MPPAVVAMAGAGVLLVVVRIDLHDVLSHVEWTTLAFFVGLFILFMKYGAVISIVSALISTGYVWLRYYS